MCRANLVLAGILLAITACCFSTSNAAGTQAQVPKSGAATKKPVFGGSGPNAGWGSIGLITKEVMKFYGWDVQICSACAGAERAARLVASAAVPPKGGP